MTRLSSFVLCLLAVSFFAPPPSTAHAYNGAAAAQYADTYWYYYNTNHYPVLGDDCTNFASQSLNAGSFPQRGYPDKSDNSWWFQWIDQGTGLWNQDPAWDNAQHFYNFLVYHAVNPGGYVYGIYPYSQYGNSMYTWANDGLSQGDFVLYAWESTGTWDHTAIQTGYGYDSYNSFYYGSLVDAHQSDHSHVIWTLREFNDYWSTTTIGLVHIQ